MKEQAVLLGSNRSLVGILTDPPGEGAAVAPVAVVLLNTGIRHRVGPGRLYVNLARDLASMGFVVLRFDFSGIGDSKVRGDQLPFGEGAVRETQEAMDYLAAVRGTQRSVLIGICSGGTISFETACRDARVVAAIPINTGGHVYRHMNAGAAACLRERAMARHYWRITFSSSFTRKNLVRALTGQADYRSILSSMLGNPFRRVLTRRPQATDLAEGFEAKLQGLAERRVRLLHLYSEGDEGLDHFRGVVGKRLSEWTASGLLEIKIIRGANHTFTMLWSQDELRAIVREWMAPLIHGD